MLESARDIFRRHLVEVVTGWGVYITKNKKPVTDKNEVIQLLKKMGVKKPKVDIGAPKDGYWIVSVPTEFPKIGYRKIGAYEIESEEER